ncbi:hypothetical protein CPAV1605_386 [seawater metagenome]|uniref:Uncharacterized protein n=1 Tax=seawater metagenome TaxID=1561972 RepID=A0A5E8CHG0_9ZZZZ
MEYTLENLDKAVFYYLSINKESPKTVNQIFHGLTDQEIVPELKERKSHSINVIKVKSLCHLMDDKYKPIHKIFDKGTLHLVYSDKEVNDILIDNNLEVEDSENEVDYDEVIKDLAHNPQTYPYIQINDTLDGKNTAFHMCCKIDDSKYLKSLLENYEVDMDIRNGDNLKGLDIVKQNNFGDHIILIKDHYYNRIITNLKNVNQKLQTEYAMQTDQADFLRRENIKKSNYLITMWTLMICSYLLIKTYLDSLLNLIELKWTPNSELVTFIISGIMLQSFFSTNVLRNISIWNCIFLLITFILCFKNDLQYIYLKYMGDENFYDYWIIHDKIDL